MTDDGAFEAHTEKAYKKARQKAGWVMSTFYSRRSSFMRHMYNTLVQPHLDYCDPLMDKIENILKNYTKQIPAIRNLNYWERFISPKMNSEVRRIERYKIMYTWKVLQEIVSNPRIEILPLNKNRSRMGNIPFTRNKKILATFQVTGPKLFNGLPKELKDLMKDLMNSKQFWMPSCAPSQMNLGAQA